MKQVTSPSLAFHCPKMSYSIGSYEKVFASNDAVLTEEEVSRGVDITGRRLELGFELVVAFY